MEKLVKIKMLTPWINGYKSPYILSTINKIMDGMIVQVLIRLDSLLLEGSDTVLAGL